MCMVIAKQFKDTSGGMAYLTQMSLLKNAAFRSLRSHNSSNDIVIKTKKRATSHFDAHYNHGGVGIKALSQ